MPFKTLEDIKKQQELHQKFLKYIVPTINFDPYLSKFDIEFNQEFDKKHNGSLSHSSAVLIQFDGNETVYSKTCKTKVMIDFMIHYQFIQAEDWLRTQLKEFMEKGECSGSVHYFDDTTGKYLKTVQLPKQKDLTAWVNSLKKYLESDIIFGGNGPDQEQEIEPYFNPSDKKKQEFNEQLGGFLNNKPINNVPQEIHEDNLVMANWIKKNCKFIKNQI